uniref:ATP synthase-coupling factor 6, mitochondrial n=1 Tax=Ditylenchus dipsaci TaxID=166011 RepID=A0A915CSV8_9BILA
MFIKVVAASSRQISNSVRINKEADLISNAFLKQIRDLAGKQKAAGGSLVNSSPEIKKQLDEQLNRLAQKFKLASAEVVGKLAVEFEKPNIESSVAALTEGKSLDDLISQVKASQSEYEKQRAAKHKEQAMIQAALSESSNETPKQKSLVPRNCLFSFSLS